MSLRCPDVRSPVVKTRQPNSRAQPGARIHSRDIRLRELKLLPRRLIKKHRPLIALVTGSNGKTTTTNMIAKIMAENGHVVGRSITEGIFFGDTPVWRGDASGYKGAGWVLTEPGVTAAALETARGDLLNRGLYMKSADVAAMTNIQAEHIGERGINTLEQMAAVKRQALDVAKRAVVLSADDPTCLQVASTFQTEKTILFTMDASCIQVLERVENGGRVVALEGTPDTGRIVLMSGQDITPIMEVRDIPAARKGLLAINIANAMAAAGLAIGLGISLDVIARGLTAFDSAASDNPGRFTLVETRSLPILVNYGSNPAAMRTTLPAIDAMPQTGTRFCLLTAPDNRPDEHFQNMIQVVAGHFDWYVLFELPKFVRRRNPGWVPAELARHLRASGMPDQRIILPGGLNPALRFVFEQSSSADLGVLFGATMYEFEKTLSEIDAPRAGK